MSETAICNFFAAAAFTASFLASTSSLSCEIRIIFSSPLLLPLFSLFRRQNADYIRRRFRPHPGFLLQNRVPYNRDFPSCHNRSERETLLLPCTVLWKNRRQRKEKTENERAFDKVPLSFPPESLAVSFPPERMLFGKVHRKAYPEEWKAAGLFPIYSYTLFFLLKDRNRSFPLHIPEEKKGRVCFFSSFPINWQPVDCTGKRRFRKCRNLYTATLLYPDRAVPLRQTN